MYRLSIISAVVMLCISSLALAQEPMTDDAPKTATGLPLPRFASLHVDEVNLRTGPGTRYPIEWVYVREGLPVEITAEFDVWRRIRDWEGSEGWIQKNALSGKRTVITVGSARDLRDSASPEGKIIAHVEASAIGQIKSCTLTWCEIEFGDFKGYMPKSDFWGTYANEEIN